MKRFLSTLALAAVLGLASCSTSYSAKDVEPNLKNKGYTVSTYAGEEVKESMKGFNYIVTVSEGLIARKGDSDIFFAFFCASIDDAEKFTNENIAIMSNTIEKYTEEPRVGYHNNVVYAGSKTAVSDSGLPVNVG